MTNELIGYPDYRRTNLAWCPSIPTHWGIRRNGGLFRQINETGHPDLPILEVSLRTGVRVRDLSNGSRKQVMANREQYKRAIRGDIAYNMMRMWQGALGVTPRDGLISPAYVVARPHVGVNSDYYARLFRTSLYLSEVNKYSRGIVADRNRLYWSEFKQIPTLVPPPPEQQEIANYTRHIERQVGAAIGNKQRLISLMDEHRRAVIENALHRGVGPMPETIESGIPWIGAVPRSWKISRIKAEFSCEDRKRIPLSSEERGRQDHRQYDYYGASGVIDQVNDYIFEGERLLIAEDGANLVLRNLPLAIIATGKFWVNNHAHVLRPRFGDITYLSWLLESIDYRPWISGAAQPKLTQDRLMAINIAIPPISEQHEIVHRVQALLAPIDRAIERTRREIDLLRQYQARLITDVVTGKLDVRAAAAALPDADPQDHDLVAAYDADEGGMNADLDGDDAAEESM